MSGTPAPWPRLGFFVPNWDEGPMVNYKLARKHPKMASDRHDTMNLQSQLLKSMSVRRLVMESENPSNRVLDLGLVFQTWRTVQS